MNLTNTSLKKRHDQERKDLGGGEQHVHDDDGVQEVQGAHEGELEGGRVGDDDGAQEDQGGELKGEQGSGQGKDMNVMMGMRERMKDMMKVTDMTVGETTRRNFWRIQIWWPMGFSSRFFSPGPGHRTQTRRNTLWWNIDGDRGKSRQVQHH